nr:MAG: hypothetical protein [Podoviridae sp. ctka020]
MVVYIKMINKKRGWQECLILHQPHLVDTQFKQNLTLPKSYTPSF